MPTLRKIERLVKAEGFQMGNIWVKQSLPADGLNQIDPFLLLHHGGPYDIKAGSDHRKMGVGPHPHRGFEPVSFVFSGSLQHRDSLGNNDILDEGDIQWMTSGKGIIHSERPTKKATSAGGSQEFIQLWVNIPAAVKMTKPAYQNMRKNDFPIVNAEKGKGEIRVISGELNGKKGLAKTFTPIMALKCEFQSGAEKNIPIPEGHNALLYLVRGKLQINAEREVSEENMVCFSRSGESISVTAVTAARFIVLTGKPIGEAVATYGPFVMNNNQEIMDAIRDYQDGKMGELIEKFD